MPSEILENISLYCLISLAYFRLLFNLSLIRSSTTRGSGTSILSRWSLQKLLRLKKFSLIFFKFVVSNPLMSRMECKYCLISTSYLAGSFYITSYLTELCVFWLLFTNEDTL